MLRKRIVRYLISLLFVVLLITKQMYPDFYNTLPYVQIDTFSIVVFVLLILTVLFPYVNNTYGRLRYYTSNISKKINKRWVGIITCLFLISIKIFSSNTQIDTNTIWLVAILALLFVLPEITSIFPYIKRVKVGELELELLQQVKKEVDKADQAVAEKLSTGIPKESFQRASNEVEQVLQESSKNPKAALLLLSSKIEEQLRNRLEEAGIASSRGYSISRSLELGVQKDIFPREFLTAFRDFWNVRNRVAHGAAFDVDDDYILSLIDLGTRLLKIASTADSQLRMYLDI